MALVRQLKTAGFRPISRYDIFVNQFWFYAEKWYQKLPFPDKPFFVRLDVLLPVMAKNDRAIALYQVFTTYVLLFLWPSKTFSTAKNASNVRLRIIAISEFLPMKWSRLCRPQLIYANQFGPSSILSCAGLLYTLIINRQGYHTVLISKICPDFSLLRLRKCYCPYS